jgi:hypothetical protein
MTGEHIMSRTVVVGIALIAIGISLGSGCGDTGHARYAPTQDEARSSLEKALTAWRDGRPCGPIEATPPVSVSDSRWQGGQRIESFEIGIEEPGSDGTKVFPVKLTMQKSNEIREVKYVVFGRDPVWVSDEQDYKRMIDMGNAPEVGRKRPGPGRPGKR